MSEIRHAKFIYFWAIVAGFSMLLMSSWVVLSYDNESMPLRVIPTVLICAVMGGFIYFSQRRTPSVYETPDFADSFYYLGFLYTLMALFVTMVLLPAEVADSNRFILGQFGLALVTTVVGLAGKLILSLYGEGDPDRLEELIAEAKRNLQAVREAGLVYRETLVSEVTDMESTLGAATKSLDTEVMNLAATLKLSGEGLEKTQKGMEESYQDLADRMDKTGEKFTDTVTSMTASLQKAQEESTSIDSHFRQVTAKLGALNGAFTALTDEITKSKDSFGTLMGGSAKVLDDSAKAVADSAKSLEKVTNSMLDEATKGGKAVSDRIAASAEAIGAYGKELEGAVKPWREVAGKLMEDRENFGKTIQAASQQIEDLATSTTKVTKEQKEASEALQDVGSELVGAVRALRKEIEE